MWDRTTQATLLAGHIAAMDAHGFGKSGREIRGGQGGQKGESDNAFYQQIVLSFNKFQQVSQQMNGQINNSKVHYIDKAKDRRTTRLMHL